jgi:hypothetical protein
MSSIFVVLNNFTPTLINNPILIFKEGNEKITKRAFFDCLDFWATSFKNKREKKNQIIMNGERPRG